MSYYHTTNLKGLYQIWLSGSLIPQAFKGSKESTLKAGEEVIFTFKNGFHDFKSNNFVVVIPEAIVGQVDSGKMMIISKLMDDLFYSVYTEYYLKDTIDLTGCKVFINSYFITDYPTSDDLLLALTCDCNDLDLVLDWDDAVAFSSWVFSLKSLNFDNIRNSFDLKANSSWNKDNVWKS